MSTATSAKVRRFKVVDHEDKWHYVNAVDAESALKQVRSKLLRIQAEEAANPRHLRYEIGIDEELATAESWGLAAKTIESPRY